MSDSEAGDKRAAPRSHPEPKRFSRAFERLVEFVSKEKENEKNTSS
jgi:hypothetical protein